MSDVQFLVEMPDGTLVMKDADDLQPEDLVVFDGPDAFRAVEIEVEKLEAEIAAAGGLEAWRRAPLTR